MITIESVLTCLEKLPALPAAAIRVSELARDERSSAVDFERVIRPDAALTANVLRFANSAYFGLRSKVESVRQAVALLGLKRTSELAAAAALGPIIPSRLPGYEIDASGFWTHCMAVAVLSERLATELRLEHPDLIFTAGLLHDIGKIAIASFVSNCAQEIMSRVHGGLAFVSAERAVLGVDHTEVGSAMAVAWKLPTAVADVARLHHAPGEAPAGTDRVLIDLVHAADALAHALGLGRDAGELARAVDPGAEERLGIRARFLERVAGKSVDEIRELAQLFAPGRGGSR